MHVVHDARKRGFCFALGAGAYDDHAVIRILADFVDRDNGVFLCFYITKLLCNLDVRFHAVSFERDFFSELFRVFQNVSNAADLGGKSSDDDAPGRVLQKIFEIFMHLALGRWQPFFESAQAFQHKRGRARQVCEMMIGDRLRVYRIVCNRPVAHMDDGSGRSREDDADCIHDRMFDLEKFYLELAEVEDIRKIFDP